MTSLEIQARYERFAEQYKGQGHIVIAECEVCGYLSWFMGRPKEPDGYSLTTLYSCPKCAEVFQRNPELSVWVLAVIKKQGSK